MGVLLFVPRQFHQSDGVSDLFRGFRGRHPVHFEAESDVFRGRHVGKKRIALKHHADAALLGLDVGAVNAETQVIKNPCGTKVLGKFFNPDKRFSF